MLSHEADPYLLDEPTTSLHCADFTCPIVSLQRLLDAGNSVIVVEHNRRQGGIQTSS